jgi:hypothetical protein
MGILNPALADKWPRYSFDPGPPEALHAVAVISACFNSFERILFDIYIHHLDRKKYDRFISEQYFLAIDERRKLDLIKQTFKRLEKKPRVSALVFNLVEYFEWCSKVRNSVLHGEIYPALFARANLNLMKRPSKRSYGVLYLSLDLPELRNLADRVEAGRMQAAKISAHLRFRDTKPRHRTRLQLRHGREPLPKLLRVPKPLTPSVLPHFGPRSQYQPTTLGL